jgi:hypothetical protein
MSNNGLAQICGRGRDIPFCYSIPQVSNSTIVPDSPLAHAQRLERGSVLSLLATCNSILYHHGSKRKNDWSKSQVEV